MYVDRPVFDTATYIHYTLTYAWELSSFFFFLLLFLLIHHLPFLTNETDCKTKQNKISKFILLEQKLNEEKESKALIPNTYMCSELCASVLTCLQLEKTKQENMSELYEIMLLKFILMYTSVTLLVKMHAQTKK